MSVFKPPVYEAWNPERAEVVVTGHGRVADILSSLVLPIQPARDTSFGDVETAQVKIDSTKNRLLNSLDHGNSRTEFGFSTDDARVVVLALSQRHVYRKDGLVRKHRIGKTLADVSRIINRPRLSDLSEKQIDKLL